MGCLFVLTDDSNNTSKHNHMKQVGEIHRSDKNVKKIIIFIHTLLVRMLFLSNLLFKSIVSLYLFIFNLFSLIYYLFLHIFYIYLGNFSLFLNRKIRHRKNMINKATKFDYYHFLDNKFTIFNKFIKISQNYIKKNECKWYSFVINYLINFISIDIRVYDIHKIFSEITIY